MFNKTDTAKSNNTQNGSLPISSAKLSNSTVKQSNKLTNKTANSSPWDKAVTYFHRLSLGTKATVLAIAIGTLPTLGIGAIAYSFANKSIYKQITQAQEAETVGLLDKINRYILGRYGDVQLLSDLPFLTNPQLRDSISAQQKQGLLDQIVKTYKAYDSIAFFDLQGNVIVQSSGETLENHQDRQYFKDALKQNTAVIGQPEISKTTGAVSVHIAAPVKDETTGQNIGVVRARLPVKMLEETIKNYAYTGHEYHLLDKSGKIFLATQNNQEGRDAKTDFPGLGQRQSKNKIDSFITVNKQGKKQQLLTYVPSIKIAGLPDLKWDAIIATDTEITFAPQRELLWTIAIGTALTALIVAAIAAWLAKQSTKPILNATEAVNKLGQGQLNTRLEVQRADELGILGTNINQMAEQLQVLLREQEREAQKAKILADIILEIRRNLKTEDIYASAVNEVQQALKVDRVIVYQLNPDTWDGIVVAEAVTGVWPRMMGVQIDDPCFQERHVQLYREGRVRAIANIYQEAGLPEANCYIEILEKFAVQGNLIAPIILQDDLRGLLIAHHCESPRNWQQSEIELFTQVATQIGYALEQAKLLEELETAKSAAQQDTKEERQQKEALQMQLLELLSNVEGAARGDLTVRADVTAGEIGTVADFFNSIVENLREIVTQVKEAASQVNTAIGSNEGAIRQLAEEAMNQASEINRTLDAVDQMTYSIQAVAENAQQAATIANHAAHTATKSGQAMDLTVQNILSLRETVGETAKKVKRLGESSQQISRVVSLINQIAVQTNLLAINAGIEAARAGEEGQGFAVVAEEVGELAVRSAAATQEIEQIVENIQRETSEVVQAMEVGTTQVVEGTRIVEDAKHSLAQILDVSRQIDELVQSISLATASQVQTSQTVSHLMKEIVAVSQRTSDSSRLVSQSLQQTVEISQELQETVGTFKIS
ncbi:methyl-accepting chemotaxis sensory transducer with phytochrome sensor [Tolypothrix tenuis PCC 7101]|uniref:Methyl-accepting chemotaxis sensory transducer with phytochrome sensor n=1 Tax=Tolypothrix tenuis PCC 7101 TaxID=231146 RepID=A0A1Z4N3L0_9CYAN|nr:HAMP domain-containing protein [Aulosira sp. FACHB-113]BAZ00330.1 methyl-accepting chemotaxis sensory transducer with phytochrome sensor [Tolypothrix tenuis PCC 7101]BAZ75749.1 methyl-accepting chemotaxis sensory transducer with phytochrome sensor [Aulosira laxa NIES-50]